MKHIGFIFYHCTYVGERKTYTHVIYTTPNDGKLIDRRMDKFYEDIEELTEDLNKGQEGFFKFHYIGNGRTTK